jgi:hypothetical protein
MKKEKKEEKEQMTLHVDTHLLHHVKLSLIYSALMDGWSVKKMPKHHNKLCFSKKNNIKHYSLQTFLQKYMPTD